MLTFENPSTKCWFLAALQAMIHVPQLANLLREKQFLNTILFTKRKNCSDFTKEVSEICDDYWKSMEHTGVKDVAHPLDLFTKINRNFGGRKLYDATECFMKMIETLDSSFVQHTDEILPDTANRDAWKEYTQKNMRSFLADVFLGQSLQTSRDGSESFIHFEGITVSMGHKSIDHGIQEFLDDPSTGVSRTITKYPLVLPIFFQKPSEKPFVAYSTELKFSNARYELFVVLIHIGNHWIAVAKGPAGWHIFDDSKMMKVTDSNFLVQKDAMMCLYKLSN